MLHQSILNQILEQIKAERRKSKPYNKRTQQDFVLLSPHITSKVSKATHALNPLGDSCVLCDLFTRSQNLITTKQKKHWNFFKDSA